ncbi:asparagine synthase (glutamine-hydrolyzing) [Amycolatopsis samaneae]|uniref:asparagine synthase (glutamine-hydrolyzing) n=1 Tax=Amycolatopsis samaneae TaxID=664691 RepID=A0ABW5GBX8_9PSEU
MCGIVGWVSFERDLTRERQVLEAMTATMACRGPDASGLWMRRRAGLGHRRLAVIDPPGGAQPMTAEAGDDVVALTYSGEVYNYAELGDELRRRGHRFDTRSDTEVVLHAYLEWGEAMAERLNGMYAFAIWDGRSEKLVLVRDRLGVKPLYHHRTADGMLFASEPKAILAHPSAEPMLTTDGVRELFTSSRTPGHAIWAGMREVRPGTVVTVDATGLREHVYWRLEAAAHADDLDTTVATVRELLDDSVARQLVSDVPLCALLSGGLDSSAVTALAARHPGPAGAPIRSFMVDFVGQSANFVPDDLRDTPDGPFVRDVVANSGTDHRDIVLSGQALADPAVRRATIEAKDVPIGVGELDNSLYLLFKAIREHSTVALSGEAADETFGGYRWFHDPNVVNAETFPWVAAFMGDPAKKKDVEGTASAFFAPEFARVLDGGTYIRDHYASALREVPRLDGEDPKERRMRELCYLHLTRYLRLLLDRKDRLSMAVGLEVRVPYCDHRLVQYVFNAPWSMKAFDGREKSLLRAATADALPRSVLERVKSPYPSTQDPKYVHALREQARDLLAEPGSRVFDVFDRERIAAAVGMESPLPMPVRFALEWMLDVATWFEVRSPVLKLL